MFTPWEESIPTSSMTVDLYHEFVPIATKQRLKGKLLEKVRSLHRLGMEAKREELGYYIDQWLKEMGSKGHYADSLFEQILQDLLSENLIQRVGFCTYIPVLRREDTHVVDDS